MKNQDGIIVDAPLRKVEAGEVLAGVQVCPAGDWPAASGNQHCTEEALNRVAERWKAEGAPEVLVDFEHRAEQGGTSDTTAAAWASGFRVEPGRGLVADFRMTDAGAEAVSNRRLRFLSVAWLVDKATREPLKITSIALTNKPNIPVAPVLNRKDASGHEHGEDGKFAGGGAGGGSTKGQKGEEGKNGQTAQRSNGQTDFDEKGERVNPDDEAAAQRRDPEGEALPKDWDPFGLRGKKNVKNKEPEEPAERNANMDKLKELLGLPAEATDDEVAAAVKSLVDAKAAAEAEKADREAEAFAEANKAKCDKDVLKAQFLANREVATALVAGIPEPAAKEEPPAQQILNKGEAKTPAAVDVVAELNKLPAGKARVEFVAAHAAELAAAAKNQGS